MVNPSVHVVSLGCAKNLVDSEVMLGFLLKARFSIVSLPAEAEIIIVNTCSFIKPAIEESLETILELAIQKKSGLCKLLIVTGCLPQRFGSHLSELLPEVDIFIGTGEFYRIVEILKTQKEKKAIPRFFLENRRYLYDDTTPRINTSPPGTAYVKIAEGCSHGCSFCIIPKLRGPFRSRHPDSVVQEVLNLSNQGIKEINLVSQDTTMYGKDLSPSANLAILLQRLARLKKIEWIRLLYANPSNLTDELIDVIGDEKKICNYIDLPLQHITQEVLKAMNRKHDPQSIADLIEKIRHSIPGVTLRTTFMVGFPGETETQFQELFDFVCRIKFDRLGVFPYYQEEGTSAARLPHQISEKLKFERRKTIMTAQATISQEKNQKLVGTVQRVLLEKPEKSGGLGRTAAQAPEVDGIIKVTADCELEPGKIYEALITGAGVYDLQGKICVSPEDSIR